MAQGLRHTVGIQSEYKDLGRYFLSYSYRILGVPCCWVPPVLSLGLHLKMQSESVPIKRGVIE